MCLQRICSSCNFIGRPKLRWKVVNGVGAYCDGDAAETICPSPGSEMARSGRQNAVDHVHRLRAQGRSPLERSPRPSPATWSKMIGTSVEPKRPAHATKSSWRPPTRSSESYILSALAVQFMQKEGLGISGLWKSALSTSQK